MSDAGIKIGDIVKLNKIGKMANNKKVENKLFEVESILGNVSCGDYKVRQCSIKECNFQKGQGIYFTDGNSRCSEVLELATDREAFLYHVAGLRERLE